MWKTPEQQRFGKNLYRLRVAKGLTQEKLAELADLHRNYASSAERGERNLGLMNIVRLARAVGVSPSRLLRGIR
ncbi:MAG: helix-turn-helix domain-containing protein [Candidatus Eremiobacteraeota bacterium]|nr:helix-turn-helix domain-containing protein [Candidatus Eremiobacteraeota bacterium]